MLQVEDCFGISMLLYRFSTSLFLIEYFQQTAADLVDRPQSKLVK